jgi:hypothetical protein
VKPVRLSTVLRVWAYMLDMAVLTVEDVAHRLERSGL